RMRTMNLLWAENSMIRSTMAVPSESLARRGGLRLRLGLRSRLGHGSRGRFQRRLELRLGVHQEIGGGHHPLPFPEPLENLYVVGEPEADLHLTRVEVPLAAVQEDDVPGAR